MGRPKDRTSKQRLEEIKRYASRLRCRICEFEGDSGDMDEHFGIRHRMGIWPLSWARYVIVLSWRKRHD